MKKYTVLIALAVLIVSVFAITSVSAHSWFKVSSQDFIEHKSVMFEQKAALFGVSAEEMKDAWAEGKNFHEFAQESGFNMEDLKGRMKESMEARMAEHLQSLVDEGVITQEQADEKSETTKEGRGFRKGFYHGFGRWHK